MAKLVKKLFTPTLMMGWALYYYIEILGKKASAGYFIKPVFWIMAALYVVVILMDVRDWRADAAAENALAANESEEVRAAKAKEKEASKQDVIRTVICIGSAVAYIFLMRYLGFILCTTLFLFGMFCWLKASNKLLAFALAVVVTMGMYALFKLGLKVPLYTGFLGF